FIVRLTLSTGKWKRYVIPGGWFVTSGIAYDPATKKLFMGLGNSAVSFDTKNEEIVRIYDRDEKSPDNFMYSPWRNRDGSYGFVTAMPGVSALRWDPKKETVSWKRLDAGGCSLSAYRQSKYTQSGKAYLPHMGWVDGISGKATPHAHPPQREANWFGKRGQYAFGVEGDIPSGDAMILRWDTQTGDVTQLFSQPEVPAGQCALTKSGKILTLTQQGLFKRYDAVTGLVELTKNTERIAGHHGVHAIVPADKNTVLGTPYISQNFWTIDTRSGKGNEMGRVAGIYGQVDNAINVNGKVYFSVYVGSQLVEYDPSKPSQWPTNPRLVAKSNQGQHGAGMTTDGQVVWCAYRPLYGTLDGAMIRYDTQTGQASYKNAAIKSLHIINPMYDPRRKQLVAGSSCLSDCDSAPRARNCCYATVLDPQTMEVTKKVIAPKGIETIANIGPLGRRKWLMRANDTLFVFDEGREKLRETPRYESLPEGFEDILYAGVDGVFVVRLSDQLGLWNAVADTYQRIALTKPGFIHHCWVHGRGIYCNCKRHVVVFKNVLPAGV
ncbi:MAG: hypothetical protein K8S55_05015, partial [Phycisphaerae bacterium]|nr:hypothetical protein [Phycisphaerae bacterium]